MHQNLHSTCKNQWEREKDANGLSGAYECFKHEQNYLNNIFCSLCCTVCPGSSDPPEKILNIFASKNEVFTIFDYCDILGWILFVYRAK